MQLERVVGMVFIPEADEQALLTKLADAAEVLLDHHTQMTDIRHPEEKAYRPLRLVVQVRLEAG